MVLDIAENERQGQQPNFRVTSGDCRIKGGCVTSPNYPNNYGDNQACTISSSGPWTAVRFQTEQHWDILTVNGVKYSGGSGPPGMTLGGRIHWSSDVWGKESGWKLCQAVDVDGRDYEKGKCVELLETSRAVDEVKVFFKVTWSSVGDDVTVIFAEENLAPGNLMIWSKKKGSHWTIGFSLKAEAHDPRKWHGVQFTRALFDSDQEYEVTILYSAKTGSIELFVAGTLTDHWRLYSPFKTVLEGPSQVGCLHGGAKFAGSIKSFWIGPTQVSFDIGSFHSRFQPKKCHPVGSLPGIPAKFVKCKENAGDRGVRINTDYANARDTFRITARVIDETLEVCAERTDARKGWGMNLKILCQVDPTMAEPTVGGH